MTLEDLPLALSVDQVAALLGVKRTAAYHWIKNGGVRHFFVGRKLRVPRSALEELLGEDAQGTAAATTVPSSAPAPVTPLRPRKRREA